MNICFLGGGFCQFGGIERVTSLVANEIAERNLASVHTLSMTDNGKDVYRVSEKVKRGHFFEEEISMKRALFKGALGKTIRYVKQNKVDIIIACGVMYFPLACLAAKLTGAKSVCWEHTSPSSIDEVTGESQIRYLGAKLSNANVLISDAALRHYNGTFRKKNNYLIHNPADPKLFSGVQPYDHRSRRLISVGRLTYQKNYPMLLEVASRVLPQHGDWSWDIYGDGEEYESLQKTIEEKSLTGKVTLKGNVSDLYDRYSQYSAIVMTSRWEGFPMVLIEAAAKGLPMISFDIPTGPNEIITDGVNGYLLPDGDPDKMAQKISVFIENPQLREQMAAASAETAKQFRIDHTVQQWMALFARLCGSKDDQRAV